MKMRLAGVLTSIALLPSAAIAQLSENVQAGTRVRVWMPESFRQPEGPWHRQQLRGSVDGWTRDTLRLAMPGATGTLAIPFSSIRRLEVSRGAPSRFGSAVERAVGGAIGGAISYALLNDPRRSGGPHYRTDWRAAGVGAAWGAGIGAVAGIILPFEQWRRVRLTR